AFGQQAPGLYFLETTPGPQAGSGIYSFSSAVPDPLLRVDDARDSWDALLAAAAANASQFDPPRRLALAAVPDAERKVPVLGYLDAFPEDPRYSALCTQ